MKIRGTLSPHCMNILNFDIRSLALKLHLFPKENKNYKKLRVLKKISFCTDNFSGNKDCVSGDTFEEQ
ncbi:hypothetical protein BpHYR1_001061, partial [Brachionus plicatilis]